MSFLNSLRIPFIISESMECSVSVFNVVSEVPLATAVPLVVGTASAGLTSEAVSSERLSIM